MKKKTSLILIATLLSLISCNNEKTSNTDTSTKTTNISSSINNDNWDIEDIYQALKEAGNGNFTFSYDYQNNHYDDVYTSNYVYNNFVNTGNILLKINNKNTVFDFNLTNSEVNLRGQTYSENKGTQGVDSIDKLDDFKKLFSDESFTDEDIFNDDGFYIESEKVIDVISTLLDFTGIEKITFDIEQGNVVLNLMAKDLDGSLFIPDGGTVTLKNIGTSSLASVETFITTFNAASPLNPDSINFDSSFSYTTNLYSVTYSTNKRTYEGQENIDSNNGLYHLINKNKNNLVYTDTVLKKGENDNLSQITIDGTNTYRVEDSTLYPSLNDLNLITKDKLDMSNFILMNNSTYLYIGTSSNAIAQALVKDTRFIKYRTSKISLETSNNKIKKITLNTEYLRDSNTDEIFYYEAEVSFLDSVNTIATPNKKEAPKDDTTIKQYFENISKEVSNFTAVKEDSNWEGKRITKYIKTNEIYSIETYVVSETGNTLETGKGYYLKNGKLYEFNYVLGEPTILGTGTDETLSSKVNWSLSSEIFFMDNETLKTYHDIHYIGKNISFTDYPLDVVSSSLKMSVENNLISKIELEYTNKEFNGSEVINITYNSTQMDAALKESLDKQIPASIERYTWADDKSTVVYETMQDSFLKDKKDLVPYLPHNVLSGTFDGYENDTNDFRIYSMGEGLTTEEQSQYINDYKSLLIELGYTLTNDQTYVNETDNIKILVGSTLDEFLQISLVVI